MLFVTWISLSDLSSSDKAYIAALQFIYSLAHDSFTHTVYTDKVDVHAMPTPHPTLTLGKSGAEVKSCSYWSTEDSEVSRF